LIEQGSSRQTMKPTIGEIWLSFLLDILQTPLSRNWAGGSMTWFRAEVLWHTRGSECCGPFVTRFRIVLSLRPKIVKGSTVSNDFPEVTAPTDLGFLGQQIWGFSFGSRFMTSEGPGQENFWLARSINQRFLNDFRDSPTVRTYRNSSPYRIVPDADGQKESDLNRAASHHIVWFPSAIEQRSEGFIFVPSFRCRSEAIASHRCSQILIPWLKFAFSMWCLVVFAFDDVSDFWASFSNMSGDCQSRTFDVIHSYWILCDSGLFCTHLRCCQKKWVIRPIGRAILSRSWTVHWILCCLE
jgi:hypothetical protein